MTKRQFVSFLSYVFIEKENVASKNFLSLVRSDRRFPGLPLFYIKKSCCRRNQGEFMMQNNQVCLNYEKN
jgi:hypothetical protein